MILFTYVFNEAISVSVASLSVIWVTFVVYSYLILFTYVFNEAISVSVIPLSVLWVIFVI